MTSRELQSFKEGQRIPTHALMQGSWQRAMAEDCGWRFYGVYDEGELQRQRHFVVDRVEQVEAEKQARAQQAAGALAVAEAHVAEQRVLVAA